MKWLAAMALILCSSMAHAEREGLSIPDNPKWKDECGSCHLAFPPQLLGAEDWRKLMGGLDKHFGANATMDAGDAKDILGFLQGHAGKGEQHSAPSLRITDTAWFKREHREVSSRSWIHPLVKTRSNCTACHVKAETGDWSERGIRMPGGQRVRDDD
jgi:hypothetical protein